MYIPRRTSCGIKLPILTKKTLCAPYVVGSFLPTHLACGNDCTVTEGLTENAESPVHCAKTGFAKTTLLQSAQNANALT